MTVTYPKQAGMIHISLARGHEYNMSPSTCLAARCVNDSDTWHDWNTMEPGSLCLQTIAQAIMRYQYRTVCLA